MRIFLLLILFLHVCSLSFAQGERARVDSLLNYLEDDPSVKVDDFALINKVCAEAEELSTAVNYTEGIFRANLIRVQIYRDYSDEKVESSMGVLKGLITDDSANVPAEYIVEYYLVRGYISGKKGLFFNELSNYLKADSICKLAPPGSDLDMYVQQHLAVYYFSQKDFKKARLIFEKIIEEQERLEIPNPPAYALYVFNLGLIYKHLGNLEEARKFMKKGIKLGSAEYKDELYQYCMLADSYLESDYLDSADVFLRLADSLKSNQIEASVDWVEYYLVKTSFYVWNKDYPSAAMYANKAIELSDSLDYITGAIKGMEFRIRSVLAAGGNSKELAEFEYFIHLKDSLNSRASLELEKKYLVEYRTLEKEAIARQKQAENDQLLLENELYRRSLMLYSSLTLALIVIFIMVVRRFRMKRKLSQKELAISELEKEKIQIELSQRKKELESKINLLRENANQLKELKAAGQRAESVQQIQEIFENNYIEENQWDNIILQFESIHPEFSTELKSGNQDFTRNDIKIAILDKLGYSNQSMQEILNISYEGVKKARQRFKKKMNT